jgi:hypothetical protein
LEQQTLPICRRRLVRSWVFLGSSSSLDGLLPTPAIPAAVVIRSGFVSNSFRDFTYNESFTNGPYTWTDIITYVEPHDFTNIRSHYFANSSPNFEYDRFDVGPYACTDASAYGIDRYNVSDCQPYHIETHHLSIVEAYLHSTVN